MANKDLSIPRTQKVAIFEKNGGPVIVREGPVVQQKDLKPGEVLVKVWHSPHLSEDTVLISFIPRSYSVRAVPGSVYR